MGPSNPAQSPGHCQSAVVEAVEGGLGAAEHEVGAFLEGEGAAGVRAGDDVQLQAYGAASRGGASRGIDSRVRLMKGTQHIERDEDAERQGQLE
jgi:hypothetical protein